MTDHSSPDQKTVEPSGFFEPYAQLVRSLLPRATSVTLYDAAGSLRWTSEGTAGPELHDLVENALHAGPEGPGQMRLLEGSLPVYLCWLRDDQERLMGAVVVVCRPSGDPDSEARGFAFASSLLRPALECIRRDLLSRTAIEELNRTVNSRDRDLELLLGNGTADQSASEGGDELKGILLQAIEQVGASTAALIVPDKRIALLRSKSSKSKSRADTQLVARAHRQLLSLAQIRHEPVIINKLAPNSAMGILPYKILSCALRSTVGNTIGVLALFRDEFGELFAERDARLTGILARKAVSIIESSYDALCGLYNRPAFERRLWLVVPATRGLRHWTALYIDVDRLHIVNDTFGMHVGDSVLGKLGELIRLRLPPGALAARISGDRFALALPTQLDAAAEFAEALREGARQLGTSHDGSRLDVSLSIGVAPLDTDAGELMHSLAAAETACKAAKDRGRNRVEVYESNDASLVRRFADIQVVGELRTAIDEGRLWLAAQLILPFAGAESHRPHFELLLRMVGEDGQSIGPDRFLSAANRYQLMPEIDRWVVNKAIEMLKPHAQLLAPRSMSFAINFSGQSLQDQEFVDFVLERLGSSGLDPAVFSFELTESAAIANIEHAELLIRKLRALGCGVALDDFGTGLSSLAYLRQLPVTMLKIDGSFVRDILKDPRAESMVGAIAQLARSLSLTTVAEYVETPEIAARVAMLGVDYGQGYAIGKPRPLIELLAELALLGAAEPVPRVADELVLEAAEKIVH